MVVIVYEIGDKSEPDVTTSKILKTLSVKKGVEIGSTVFEKLRAQEAVRKLLGSLLETEDLKTNIEY